MQTNMQNWLHSCHVLHERGWFTQLCLRLRALDNSAVQYEHILRVKETVGVEGPVSPLYTSRGFYFELALF